MKPGLRLEGNEDYSRKKYSGYEDQAEYQRDARDHWDGKICGALTSSKKMCRNDPMENGRCRLHGGKSPKGLDHPRTTHGSYSKYLPKSIIDKYEAAQSDAELLTLKNEVQLISARLYQLAEKVDEAGGKKKYETLLHQYDRWQKAEANNLKNKHMAKLNFENTLDDIKKDLGIWDEITMLVDTKRKLIDSEQRKLASMEQFVPAERVAMLMGALMKIVVDELEDLEGFLMDGQQIEKARRNVARKFRNISNRGSN